MTTLPDLPPTLAETRAGLHQLAFFALAPYRYAHVGRLGLEAAPGGFATPSFDVDGVARRAAMDRDELVVTIGDDQQRSRPTTVAEAAAAVAFLRRGHAVLDG